MSHAAIYSLAYDTNLRGGGKTVCVVFKYLSRSYRDGGHEQLISNGERFKPAFAERDKKQQR
jgi:hypothetical protein